MSDDQHSESQRPSTAATRPGGVVALASSPLRAYFEAAVRFEASDVLLREGAPPRLRVGGVLRTLDAPALGPEELADWVGRALGPALRKTMLDTGAADLSVELPGGYRFRVNVYRASGLLALSARWIRTRIRTFEELMLPPVLNQLAQLRQGLVLMTGVTGCGKSTTLASVVQHINEHRACHILTIEDPIEYLFKEDRAFISQREVGIDVPSFASGLHAMLRESPDVLLIGEMRDKTAFEAAFQAAETGHLVLGTVHASGAAQVFGRIYEMFSPEERGTIRNMLAWHLQAVVCQKLLLSIKPERDRVAAVEVLLQSPPTRKFILEGREHELGQVMRDQRQAGMVTLTDSLVDLVNREWIHPRTAQAAAHVPEEVRMRLKGISTE